MKVFFFRILQNLLCLGTAFKTIRRNLLGKKLEPECQLLEKIIKPGDVCFDVGAGYGRFALFMSRLVGPKGSVYCFEPGDFSDKVFRIIKWFHALKNVQLHKTALSNENKTVKLVIPIKDGNKKPGPSLAYVNTCVRLPKAYILDNDIEMTPLDDFCRNHNIQRLNFLKCDVEGGELLFLRGAREALLKFKPVILMEIDPGLLVRFDHTAPEVFDVLKGLNYETFRLVNEKFESVPGFVEGEVNYFFFPKEKSLGLRA